MSELDENLIKVEVDGLANQVTITAPLTLRDFFAAFALIVTDDYPRDIRAGHAYALADAMLAERVKEKE